LWIFLATGGCGCVAVWPFKSVVDMRVIRIRVRLFIIDGRKLSFSALAEAEIVKGAASAAPLRQM
jgi:hypothetical protein